VYLDLNSLKNYLIIDSMSILIFLCRSPYISSERSFDSSSEDRDRLLTASSSAVTILHKTADSPALSLDAFPQSEIPSPVNEDNIPRSDAPYPDELLALPQAVCVVDGLYSVRSPKGHKVLVGVEVIRTAQTSVHSVCVDEDREEVITAVVDEVDGSPPHITTQILRKYSFETDYPQADFTTDLLNAGCPTAEEDQLLYTKHSEESYLSVDEKTIDDNFVSSEEREYLTVSSEEPEDYANARTSASSTEEAKSGSASPFFSPTSESPDMTITNSSKMDKEVS